MTASPELFEARSRETDERLATFREALSHLLGNDARSEAGERTTVYVTGSGGRGEMSEASDLDLFLVTETGKPSALYAPILQSAIIRATRECGIDGPICGWRVSRDAHRRRLREPAGVAGRRCPEQVHSANAVLQELGAKNPLYRYMIV